MPPRRTKKIKTEPLIEAFLVGVILTTCYATYLNTKVGLQIARDVLEVINKK